MTTQTISTKELRQDFSQVIDAMEQGKSLLLLYRSKPLAEIKPVSPSRARLRSFSQKQLQQWIDEDQLTPKQQAQINAILNRTKKIPLSRHPLMKMSGIGVARKNPIKVKPGDEIYLFD